MNAVAKVLLECLRQNNKPHKAFETKASPCLRAAKRASRKVSLRAANNPQRSCAQPNPEVCGKIQWCQPHRIATTLLPAVSLLEKGGVLGGSGICRILPEKAVKPESAKAKMRQMPLGKQPFKHRNAFWRFQRTKAEVPFSLSRRKPGTLHRAPGLSGQTDR